MLYVHKHSLVQIEEQTNGDMLVTDHFGNKKVLSYADVCDEYITVEIKEKIHIDKEMMAKGYEEMAEINLHEANSAFSFCHSQEKT